MKVVLSDEGINKYGFRVLTDGLDITEFMKNPVMFYKHDRDLLPIGKWINIEKKDGKLIGEPDFDMTDPFAIQIKQKWDAGILNSASIGFNVMSISEEPKDLLKGQTRPTVLTSRLDEASITDIPGNGGCYKMHFSKENVTLSGDMPEVLLNSFLPQLNLTDILMTEDIALALGLPANADKATILAAIAKTKQNAALALSKFAKTKGMKEETINKLGLSDFEGTLTLVDETEAPKVSEQPTGDGKGTPEKKEDLTDTGRTLSLLEELIKTTGQNKPAGDEQLSFSQMLSQKPAELKKLIAEKPDQAQKLFLAEFGKSASIDDLKKLI